MKIIKILWGLIFDDARLVLTLLAALGVALLLMVAQQALLAAIVIWGGLVVALWFSIEHELAKKIKARTYR